MSLIKRNCPFCKADDYKEVVILREHHFTKNNPSYRLDRIPELGLDPDQHYPIVSCRQCGMVYSLYHLDDAKELIVYNRIIDTEVSRNKVLTIKRKLSDLKRCQNLLTLTNIKRHNKVNLKVLDYGCGWGTLLLTVKGLGIDVVGFEPASYKADWARKQGLYICNSEEKLFTKAPYDICISTSVLEHLRDPVKALNTITSLLKPGGFAHITGVVGGIRAPLLWGMIRKRVRQKLPIPKEINPWEHLNYFTHGTFSKLLKNSGFISVSISERRCLPSMIPNIWANGYWQLKNQG